MGLKRMLVGKWFTRLVLISWILCAVSILIIFKNMELIVHGQLYNYYLVFSPDWADPYRIFTWLIFLGLGLPMALSGVALFSSFLKVEEAPKKAAVSQRLEPPQGVIKTEPPKIVKDKTKKFENDNGTENGIGISCPNCNKIFGRALVMLDFRSGKNRMISVCPYCNKVLGYASEEKAKTEDFQVESG